MVSNAAMLLLQAREASAQNNWEAALELWQALKELNPASKEAHLAVGNAFGKLGLYEKANGALVEAHRLFPNNSQISAAYSWNAADRGDWMEAISRWREFLETFPSASNGYVGLSLALSQTNQINELENVLEEGFEKFPDHIGLATQRASFPLKTRDGILALERFQALNHRRPNDPTIIVGLSKALQMLEKFDEAEHLLTASEQCASSFVVASSIGTLLAEQRKWDEAIVQWEQVTKNFPEFVQSHLGLIAALRGAGLKERADSLLQSTTNRFPDNVTAACDFGWLSINERDWQKALQQWQSLVIRFPNSGKVAADYSFVLLSSEKLSEAESFLVAALIQFPENLSLRVHSARSASYRQDWVEAVKRWTNLQKTHPAVSSVKDGLALARYNKSFSDAGSDEPQMLERAVFSNADFNVDNARLVSCFESIGENCEFGLLQRAVGAEPLGLLRFAGTVPTSLIAVLQARFDGVGEPEHTTLREEETEYVTSDTRYGMTMHTFVKPSDGQFEPTYKIMTQKIRFLRRKLIEDLEDGEKIFLYKVRYTLSEPHIAELRSALSLYSRTKLFVVRLATADHPDGDIEVINDRFMIGYIDRHGHDNTQWNIPVESWIKLCRKAYSLFPDPMTAQ